MRAYDSANQELETRGSVVWLMASKQRITSHAAPSAAHWVTARTPSPATPEIRRRSRCPPSRSGWPMPSREQAVRRQAAARSGRVALVRGVIRAPCRCPRPSPAGGSRRPRAPRPQRPSGAALGPLTQMHVLRRARHRHQTQAEQEPDRRATTTSVERPPANSVSLVTPGTERLGWICGTSAAPGRHPAGSPAGPSRSPTASVSTPFPSSLSRRSMAEPISGGGMSTTDKR